LVIRMASFARRLTSCELPLTWGVKTGKLLTIYLKLHKDTLQIPRRAVLSTLHLGTPGKILKARLNNSVSEIPVAYMW